MDIGSVSFTSWELACSCMVPSDTQNPYTLCGDPSHSPVLNLQSWLIPPIPNLYVLVEVQELQQSMEEVGKTI